jgi:hypothetical protein
LTQYTFGALNPLTVEDYTLAELSEYVAQMEQAQAKQPKGV